MNFIQKVKSFKRKIVRFYYKHLIRNELQVNEIPCPLCENEDYFEILFKSDRYGLPITTVICGECNLVFTCPMPTSDFLNNFYSKGMFRGLDWGIVHINKKITEEFGALKRASKHVNFISFLLSEKHIERIPESILDIGSSDGSFLLECMEKFPKIKTYGIEPGKNFRIFSEHQFTMIYDDLSKVPQEKRFGLITMWHVLEHIKDPVGFLKKVRTYLGDNGLLIFEVPDYDKYDGISPIHIDHVIHLNKKTIDKLLEKSGFKTVIMSEEKRFLMDERYGIKVVAKSK